MQRGENEWAALCRGVQQQVPRQIGTDAWEVITAAVLIASPEPQLLGEFYTYLVQKDSKLSTEDGKTRLSLRFRDAILKLMTLVGAPQVISALIPLAKAEGETEAKAKNSSLSLKWQHVDVPSIHARGQQTIDTIYGPLLPKIFQSWGAHTQDLQFNEVFAVYGLYLSDFEVMSALETEAVVFATICCTGLRGPSLWHMRGMGRLLGARGSDDENEQMRSIKNMLRALKTAIMSIVDFVGEDYVRRANLAAWVNVGDVTRELGGWGDDV